MSKNTFGPGEQHPEQWRQDLNPDANAGENYANTTGAEAPLTLADIKEAHGRCQGLTRDELGRIPVLREGERLDQGATYMDLAAGSDEITAMGAMSAGPGQWWVRKDTVGYDLWNRLRGVQDDERTLPGRASA